MTYTLIHGDALEQISLLESESIDLVVMDPPYDSMNAHLKLGAGRIVGDGSEGEWFRGWSDDPDDFEIFLMSLKRVMKPGAALFCMFDPMSLLKLGNVIGEVFDTKCLITWDKINIGMGHYFRRRSEFIVFAGKGKPTVTDRSTSDVWQIKRVNRPKYPTQKPIELYAEMIRATLAEPGATILDPFLGSGSSAVAAIAAGHNFIGIDVKQEALDMALERLMVPA